MSLRCLCPVGPDSGLSQGSTKDLEFELVFNEGDCAAMVSLEIALAS